MKIYFTIFAVVYGDFAVEAHKKHNELRQLHKDTPNLVLDAQLCDQAQVSFLFNF